MNKCPSDRHVICSFLEPENLTIDQQPCADCPHNKPMYEYLKEPQPEGRIFPFIILAGIVIVVLGLMYIIGQFFMP